MQFYTLSFLSVTLKLRLIVIRIHDEDLKNSINTATFILSSKLDRLTILTTRYVTLKQCGPSTASSVTTSTASYYKFLLLFVNIIDADYLHNDCVRTT